MPKHFRQCSFCKNDNFSKPDIVIFTANMEIKRVLNISEQTVSYICEEHFPSGDVKPHGTTKRLRDGAVPLVFPRQEAVQMDHDYTSLTPLDMVKHLHIFT